MSRLVLLLLALLGASPAEAHPDPDSIPLWGRLVFEAREGAPTAVRVETFSRAGEPADGLAASLELFRGLARTRLRLEPGGRGVYTGELALAPGFWRGVVRFEGDDRWLFGDFGFWIGAGAEAPREPVRFGTRRGGPFALPPWLDHLGWAGVVGGLLVAAPLLARRPAPPPAPRTRLGLPGWGIGLATLGALAGPLGAYWDVAWHVDRGRETFWSPPHLVIYGGIAAVLVALVAGVAALEGSARRTVWRHPGLRFTLIASAVVLASAPFDEAWHALFGLDVSIWSPPHLALLFGSGFSLLGLAIIHGDRIAARAALDPSRLGALSLKALSIGAPPLWRSLRSRSPQGPRGRAPLGHPLGWGSCPIPRLADGWSAPNAHLRRRRGYPAGAAWGEVRKGASAPLRVYLPQLLLSATALLVIGLFTHEFEYAILERWHVIQGRPPGLYPLASSILLALVLTAAARVGRRPGTASLVALIAWTFRALVSLVFLPALGHTAPILPPLWPIPALALDGILLLAPRGLEPQGALRGRAFVLGGLAATTVGYLAYAPTSALLAGKALGAAELWGWFPLALAASAAAGYLGFRIGWLVEAPPASGQT